MGGKNNTVLVVLLLFHYLAEISLFFSLPLLLPLAFFETRSQQPAHAGLKLTVLPLLLPKCRIPAGVWLVHL